MKKEQEKQTMKTSIEINGLKIQAEFPVEAETKLWIPLLKKWKENNVKTVLLAGPPGSGKSTLVFYLEQLARHQGIKLTSVGMDGFHHTNAWLKENNLSDRKGAPETFDFEALEQSIKSRNVWPVYSRQNHEPDWEHPIYINTDTEILLIEGNYLLLDQEPWNRLKNMADYAIVLKADSALLEKRLIERKTASGKSRLEAEIFCRHSDLKNVKLVLENTIKNPDLLLEIKNDSGGLDWTFLP